MSLMHQFFKGRDDLLNRIRLFEFRHNLSLLKRLEAEVDEGQFLSLITEIQFGLFLGQFASTMKYESSLGNKTPDWTIEMNGQTIIAEVVRLNPSAKVKASLDFDDNLMNAMHEIKIGAFLHFDYNEKTIDRIKINFDECRQLIEQWLFQTRHAGDTILLFDSIEFEFGKYSNKVDHVCLAGGGGTVNYDDRRL